MKRILFIIILFLSCRCIAQTDTVFWFAPPDLSDSFGETPVRLVFHTYDQPANITVEQPANSLFPTTTLTMAANSVSTYNPPMPVSMIETTPTDTILDRGFHIHSTAPITCYYQSISQNRETYTLKGRNALGTDFEVLAPMEYLPNNQHNLGQSIELIATEDNTHITIIAPEWRSALDSALASGINILLNRGQSYAFRNSHYGADLIKIEVHATKPIAVNATSDALMSRPQNDVPATYNLAGEQLLPLSFWGTKYVRINHFTTSETFRATDYLATGSYGIISNGTLQGINYGNMVWNTNGPTNFDSVDYIISERPLGMIHQLDPGLKMGFTLLPQLDCSGSNLISYLHSDSLTLSIHMVIDSNAVTDLRFNNDSSILTPNLFRPLPGLPSKVWCNTRVDQYLTTDSVMTISCSTAKFILAVIESDSTHGTSYTYLTDYAPYTLLKFSMDTVYCVGDSITFSYSHTNIDSMVVYGPNGLLLTRPPFVIPSADTTMSGRYIIEGFNHDGCHRAYLDTVNIVVHPNPSVELYDTIDEGQLPWSRFNTLFYDEADTFITRPNPQSPCDSLYHYHLTVLHTSHDTVLYYACPSDLPIQYDTIWFYQERERLFRYTGSQGQDSLVTFILHVLENSDTTIYDTIMDTQLPWFAFDTVFNDSVADFLFHTYNEAGCDSLIHYNLYIFWNGDHCDTSLSYPNVVTPNGDGINDRFVIGGLIENNCFKYNELIIYDRTGRQVYHKANIATEADWWNPAEQRIPSGTYFYYFKAHGVNIWTQHRGIIEVLHEK